MCYYELTRWSCGYWRWGFFRQQCNKEYRMGETCGLKLVYETKAETDECKLCHDIEKKQRRYDKMYRDVQRWRMEGNRSATIEKTCGEMEEIGGQIQRMRDEHDHRLQLFGQGVILSSSVAPSRIPASHHSSYSQFDVPATGAIAEPELDYDINVTTSTLNRNGIALPNIIPGVPAHETANVYSGSVNDNYVDLNPEGSAATTSSSDQHNGESSMSTGYCHPVTSPTGRAGRTLDFEFFPTFDELRSVVSNASLNESGYIFEGKCRVYWHLLEFCNLELDLGVGLNKVVTLTGTPTCAEVDSCQDFMEKIWSSTTLIDFITTFIKDPGAIRDPFKLSRDLHITIDELHNDEKHEVPSYTCFSISGPLPEVTKLIQQLAWLTAAFFLPAQNVLTISTAVLEVTEPGVIIIQPKNIGSKILGQSLTGMDKSASCWHHLFRGAVLAYGFPTSERVEGTGLEIPFDLMVALADIRTQIDVGQGITLLGGAGVVLYPTKILNGAIQWHCARVDDDDYVKHGSDPAAIVKNHDINNFSGHKTFLGYYPQAEVLLGTRELVESIGLQASVSKFPPAPPRIELANEGTFSGGMSIKGILSMNFGGKYIVSKTLRVSLEGRGYHDLVDQAEQQPALIYDGETKSAWLVSELSVVLHIALSYLSSRQIQDRRQTGLKALEGEWPQLPYAEPCSDGGSEARKVCKQPENCKIELWAEDTKNKTFGDVIEDILKDFRAIRDGIVVQRKAARVWPMPKIGLRGWEYSDLVARRGQVCQKEVPREGHDASWWELGNVKNTLVILGYGFGRLIRPKAFSKNPLGLINIPPGSRY